MWPGADTKRRRLAPDASPFPTQTRPRGSFQLKTLAEGEMRTVLSLKQLFPAVSFQDIPPILPKSPLVIAGVFSQDLSWGAPSSSRNHLWISFSLGITQLEPFWAWPRRAGPVALGWCWGLEPGPYLLSQQNSAEQHGLVPYDMSQLLPAFPGVAYQGLLCSWGSVALPRYWEVNLDLGL
jgi:hypothetical protein